MKKTNFKILQDRTWLLSIVIFLLLVFALSRFFYLQIIEGRNLKVQREANINTFEYIYPKRGRIISSDGYVLAEDRKTFSLVIDFEQKPSEGSIKKLSQLFPSVVDFDETRELVRKSLNSRKPEILIEKLDQEKLAKFLVRSSEFGGFSIIEGYEREYDNHPSFFHVLGHMGYLTEADVEYFSPRINSFDPSIWRRVGKSGVERVFEEELRGSHGKRFYQRNARGTKRVITGEDSFQEGEELKISINYEAQKIAYDLIGNRKGSVVVIDLEDFSIPVAVSAPSISANTLRDITSSQYQDLLNDSNRPLFNRAFMGLYPPASTIKPLLSAFALSNQYTSWEETIFDDGFFRFEEEERVFNAWREGGHGLTDLSKALIESSNPFFMNLSIRYEKNKFVNFLESSSFGSKLCQDCYPHQFSPLIDDNWKQKNFGKDLFKGDFINLGVGQGYMLTTPLHLALISGILASKGNYKLPYLATSNEESLSINTDMSDSDWEKLNKALIDVIYSPNGTGFRINAGALKLAGKSGTAQVVDINSREEYDEVRKNNNLRDHAIFIGYAPYDDPKFSIAVIIENGESGGRTAGPIAKEVLEGLLDVN